MQLRDEAGCYFSTLPCGNERTMTVTARKTSRLPRFIAKFLLVAAPTSGLSTTAVACLDPGSLSNEGMSLFIAVPTRATGDMAHEWRKRLAAAALVCVAIVAVSNSGGAKLKLALEDRADPNPHLVSLGVELAGLRLGVVISWSERLRPAIT